MRGRNALISTMGCLLVACGTSGAAEVGGTGGTSGTAGTGGIAGTGGSAGVGGDGGSGGMSGASGSAGGPAVPAGIYGFECALEFTPIPLRVTIEIEAAEVAPPLQAGRESILTTQLLYRIGPDVVAPIEPDGDISELDVVIDIEGATPIGIVHSIEGLPVSPWPILESDVVVTDPIAPSINARKVALRVMSFRILVTDLPEALVPGGEVRVASGEGNCTDFAPVEGSGPVVFPVVPAP